MGFTSFVSSAAKGKAMQNLGRSFTGANVKAVLCIRKVENVEAKAQDVNKDSIDGRKYTMSDSEKSAIDDVYEINKQLMKRADQSLSGKKAVATFSEIKAEAEKHKYIALEVQYNPSSMRLDTIAGQQKKYNGDAGKTQMEKFFSPSVTTLSCDLLFDDFNNMDAFMLSDNALTGATAANLASTAVSMARGSKFSVQRQIEGLIALLTIPEARHVIFYWGDMCFRGEVNEVNARYTMFNKKGNPIRGMVGLQIRQGDNNDEYEAYRYDETYWYKAFDSTFTEKSIVSSTFSKATNNSLLNLKL
ncbi:MAG: hypothetical protein K6G42_09765 [Lachnospiraceae bacterium]|nr:hypothetical protein [Lachnospiraceae bacterium]